MANFRINQEIFKFLKIQRPIFKITTIYSNGLFTKDIKSVFKNIFPHVMMLITFLRMFLLRKILKKCDASAFWFSTKSSQEQGHSVIFE